MHPDSPAGRTGTGFSRSPRHDSESWAFSPVPHPDSPAGRLFPYQMVLLAENTKREGRADKLTNAGFTAYDSLGIAGSATAHKAFTATRNFSGDHRQRPEFGALIFESGGKYLVGPLTPGEATRGGPVAYVLVKSGDPSRRSMLSDLVKGVAKSGVPLQDITIVGMAHSHPFGPGFPDDDHTDKDVYAEWAGKRRQGLMRVEFRKSFIWGPKWDDIRGKSDPEGQLYVYPP